MRNSPGLWMLLKAGHSNGYLLVYIPPPAKLHTSLQVGFSNYNTLMPALKALWHTLNDIANAMLFIYFFIFCIINFQTVDSISHHFTTCLSFLESYLHDLLFMLAFLNLFVCFVFLNFFFISRQAI